MLWGVNPSSSFGATFLGYLRYLRLGGKGTHRSGGPSFKKWVLLPGVVSHFSKVCHNFPFE